MLSFVCLVLLFFVCLFSSTYAFRCFAVAPYVMFSLSQHCVYAVVPQPPTPTKKKIIG